MNICQFYNLISYQKCINLISDVVKTLPSYEAFKLKIYLVKTMKHIAHSQSVTIYPKTQRYQYKEALKWLYKTEKEMKGLNILEKKKKQYIQELNEVRKLLIALNKKIQVEDIKND